MSGSPPKTVLHVFNFFKPDFTGEGIYVTALLPLFHARGVRSDVLVKRTHKQVAGRRVARETEPAPHTVHYLPLRWSRVVGAELQLAWWMARFARRYDVIHFHSFCSRYFVSIALARAYGCKVVQSCTLDDSPHAMLETYRSLWRPLIRRLYGLVHEFVSISPKLWEESREVVDDAHNHLIPQGVSIPPAARPGRAEARARHGLGADDLALLFVGAINPRKDVRFLVERLNVLRDELPTARLFLVGPVLNDEYGEDLDRRIAELGLDERVVRVGYVEDPTEYYALADALVFASRLEGFGNVLLEAMAHELPLLVRRLPGVTDSFIEHGRTGVFFDTEEEYDAQLLRLAREPALRAELGRAARAEVAARFSLETVADRYVALYDGRPSA